jgi:DNA repair photolyase
VKSSQAVMIVKEIQVKTILSKSKIYDYVVNPYRGCQHGCSYCYARFMKRFTHHPEPWGEYVDIKINAAELLEKEITKKEKGRVWVSGVCDPYQPIEAKYKLTRRCLEVLIHHQWPVTIQTRSPLVTRDIDLLKNAMDVEVGMSITTADEAIRRLFEPQAPTINSRIAALEELHNAGISTFAMIAPVLPRSEGLPALLKGKVDFIRIDRLNYHYADWLYSKLKMEDLKTERFFYEINNELVSACQENHIDCTVIG